MDKIATLVKEAEVRGVLAGLADAGHLKIASAEELEAFTEAVSGLLPDAEYDLNDVLNKTAEVLEYLESDEELEKEAGEEELDETALMAAFGELSMMKMAGEIDDETFEKEAASIQEILHRVGGALKNTYTGDIGKGMASARAGVSTGSSSIGKWLADGFKGTALRKYHGMGQAGKQFRRDVAALGNDHRSVAKLRKAYKGKIGTKAQRKSELLKGLAQTGTAAALTATGTAGAAYGGKKLYDKYKK